MLCAFTRKITLVSRIGRRALQVIVRIVSLVFKIFLFLLLLGLAARNSDFVTVRYFLGLEWQAPLVLVLFAAFAIGLVTGLLACSVKLLKNNRELRALRKPAKLQ